MRTADDQRSEKGSVEAPGANRGEAGRLEAGHGTGNAWIGAWQVLNTPAGVVVSVVVAFGSVTALLMTVFLGQLNRMEDRLEDQIGEVREAIEEMRNSGLAQIGELGDSIRVTEQRLLAQIRELADSMRAGDQRLLAEINRRTGESGEQ